jgi:hypothetical protein
MNKNTKNIILSALGLATLLSFAVLAHPAAAATREYARGYVRTPVVNRASVVNRTTVVNRAPVVNNARRSNKTYRYTPPPTRRGARSSSETVTAAGYVTALNGSTFTMVANAGPSAYVNTANAAITGRDGASLSALYIAVNDQVTVTGTVSGSTIMATSIVDRTASQYSYNGYNNSSQNNAYNGYYNPSQNNSSGASNGSVSLSLSPYASTLSAGQSTTVTADAYDADGIANVNIYVNGSLAQSCPLSYYPASGTCALTLYGSNYAYGSNITVYAQTTDRYGNIATSATSTLLNQSNAAASDSTVSLSFSPYVTTLSTGQSTNAMATAYAGIGISSIGIYVNGSLVQSCPFTTFMASANCVATISANNYANGSTVSLYAKMTDNNGNVLTSSTSSITTQNNTTGNSNGSVTVSLSPYATTLTGNQTTYITANSYDTDGIATTSIYVNGSLVQSCPVSNYPTSSTCSSSIYGENYAYGSNITVYAQTTDRYGNIATSATSTIAKW